MVTVAVLTLDRAVKRDRVELHVNVNEFDALSVAVDELVDDEWQRDEHFVAVVTFLIDVYCVLQLTLETGRSVAVKDDECLREPIDRVRDCQDLVDGGAVELG